MCRKKTVTCIGCTVDSMDSLNIAMAKYDQIGMMYDTTRRADPVLVTKLAALLRLEKLSYLDIACGSGNYTSALAEIGGRWSGIDQSGVMLGKARMKSVRVNWFQGDAEALPFCDDSFEGVMCTLAIHHFPSLEAVFSEVRRVLAEGRFVLFTSTKEQMKGYWLNEYFPVAMERSIEQMPRMSEIGAALETAGLKRIDVVPYFVHDDLQDLFLYSGKHRPEMYLDQEIRRGISTFSSLADQSEIDEGCRRLREEIGSAKIKKVIRDYENERGDYCFVVCE